MGHSLSTIEQVVHSFNHAQSTQFSGRFICTSQDLQSKPWFFDFREGEVVWVKQPHHQNRRWIRVLRQQCPDFFKQHWPEAFRRLNMSGQFIGEYWELTLLEQSNQAGILSSEHIQRILQAYLTEALTDLAFKSQVTQHWIETVDVPASFMTSLSQASVQAVQKRYQQWHILSNKYAIEQCSSQFSLDLAPVITDLETLKQQVDPLILGQLSKLLTGQNTLWDIAGLLQQDWISVTSVLLPLIKAKSIELKSADDINLKSVTQTSPATLKSSQSNGLGLIACIDDSPVIAKELERMLRPYGFEVLSILDPLKGFKDLITAKPRLIFLDLVMPNTNGYEVCSVLRKSAQFKDLPVVMLTGHDGIVDRLRAKMAGSTDFLGKPPEITKVLQILEKHLKEDLLTVSKENKPVKVQNLPA